MKKQRLLPYRQAVPAIWLFQLISCLVLQLWMFGYSKISMLLINSTGRVAVTSGDFKFLFTTWQGVLLILITLLTLFLFVGLNINSLIILSKRLLTGEKPSVLLCIKEGFLSIKRILNPVGLLVVLFISLFAPIIGFGIMISLTQEFYIPKFISSVIWSNPLYSVGMVVVIAALFAVGLLFAFILHGAVLDGIPLSKSAGNSLKLVRRNLKKYIFELFRFFITLVIIFVISVVVVVGVLFLVFLLPVSQDVMIPLSVALLSTLFFVLVMMIMMVTPFFILKLTSLYLSFNSNGEWSYEKRKKRKSPVVIATASVVVLSVASLTVLVSIFYEIIFPNTVTTGYIAHRAGGYEAPENTVAGLEAAYKLNASGGEIDIQRTSDGKYVVNHDADFSRVAGVNKKPSEMTLEEVKQLRVDGEPVPTFEEMLETSKDKLTLYVELKGETADLQMAEDAVKTIKDYNMIDGAVVISLKYDLIDYIETNYPEIQTGYLAFASFGDTESLNCDYLALEEEVVTDELIGRIHNKGKKLLIWTVNEDDDISDYIQCGADELITDNVSGAKRITEEIEEASPMLRIINGMLRLFSRYHIF